MANGLARRGVLSSCLPLAESSEDDGGAVAESVVSEGSWLRDPVSDTIERPIPLLADQNGQRDGWKHEHELESHRRTDDLHLFPSARPFLSPREVPSSLP